MTEPQLPPDPADPLAELRARADALERQLAASHADTDARVIRAELKAEAIRAGMVDLDGLKLLDLAAVKLSPTGEVDGAGALMARMKRDKPWLFGGVSSSSSSTPPPAQAPRKKLAKDMTDAEYRSARADLIKRR
jgi:hypothetical protein